MPAKTRYLAISTSTQSASFTVASNRTERVEASQITTSGLGGVQVRLSVERSSTVAQLAHDIYIPAEKIVEPLFRGLTFEDGDIVYFAFASGSATDATWLALTTDQQTV